jgi:hypothetical protein
MPTSYSLAAEVVMSSKECDVIRVAERYVSGHYPDFDTLKYPPVVTDGKDRWVVSYQLPVERLGGTPVIEIAKGTLAILKTYRTQ